MKRNLIKDLFNPGKSLILYVLIVNLGLGLASAIFSELILNTIGTWVETNWGISELIFRLCLFTVILFPLLLIFYIIKFANKWYSPATIKPQPLKATFPGLIVVASKSRPGTKSAAQAAIEEHWLNGKGNLQHCWIICGGQDLLDIARQILKQIGFNYLNQQAIEYELKDPDNRNRILKVSLRTIKADSVDDPNTTFTLVNKIYAEAEREGIEESDIIADYTGGTKSMTSGMILACATPQRQLQFMKPGGYLDDGRADPTKNAIATEVQIAFKLKLSKGR